MNRKFTREEICTILDDCISVYPTSNKWFEIWALLNHRGLYRQMINHYINVKPTPDIIQRMNLLKELQESKILNGLFDSKSQINPTGAIFLLKCKRGYIEEDKRKSLELQEKKLEQETEVIDTITDAVRHINFTTAEHRTDDEIQQLIDEAQSEKE